MKNKIENIIAVLIIITLMWVMFFIIPNLATGSEDIFTPDNLNIRIKDQPERTVSISQTWETKISASVPANPCNICLRLAASSFDCLEACSDIVIYEE